MRFRMSTATVLGSLKFEARPPRSFSMSLRTGAAACAAQLSPRGIRVLSMEDGIRTHVCRDRAWADGEADCGHMGGVVSMPATVDASYYERTQPVVLRAQLAKDVVERCLARAVPADTHTRRRWRERHEFAGGKQMTHGMWGKSRASAILPAPDDIATNFGAGVLAFMRG
jgi:hypothetical protein